MIKLTDILEGVGFGNKMGSINYIPTPIPKDHARNDNVTRIKSYPSTPGITSNKTFNKTPKQVVHVKEYGRYEGTEDWIDRAVKKALGVLGRFRCKNKNLSDDPVFLKNDWNCVANELYSLDYDDLKPSQQLIVRKTWDKQRKELGLEESVGREDYVVVDKRNFKPLMMNHRDGYYEKWSTEEKAQADADELNRAYQKTYGAVEGPHIVMYKSDYFREKRLNEYTSEFMANFKRTSK